MAKQSRLIFPISNSSTASRFYLLHVDVWGPYKVPTYDRKSYFVTVVDDYSIYTWVCLVQSKYQVIVVLRNFLHRVKNQYEGNVKVLRIDNDEESFNSSCHELFSSLGIIHQSSYPYTPQ